MGGTGAGVKPKRSIRSTSNPAVSIEACVSRAMWQPCDPGPERRVGDPLQACRYGPVRDHVLVEAQLAAWLDDAPHLGQSFDLIGDGAQDQRGDRGVLGAILGRKGGGNSVDHLDGDGRLASSIAAFLSSGSGSTASTASTAAG